MFNNFLKQAVGVAVGACLLAGCSSSNNSSGYSYSGSSSSGSSSSSSSGSSAPTSIVVTGMAVKGVIQGGAVTVYPVVNGSLDLTTVLGTDTTNASGGYSIDIDDYDGSPVAIRVTASEDTETSMKCDVVGGCGDAAFGERFVITDTSFNLDAIVPSVDSEAVSVNLSVLTDAASELALGALAANNTAAEASAIIANSNSSVANRFGIIGNLTELPVIDITDPAKVAEADNDVLEYNLYNAAIVKAVLSGDNQATITSAVNRFAQQYAGGGIADKKEENSTSIAVTLADILQTSSTVITAITEVESDIVLDLGGLQTQLTANAAQALNGSTVPEDGSLEQGEGEVSELLTVKKMVNDLRNLATGADLTAAETFSTQLDLAGDTFDAESGAVLKAMAMATGSISYAFQARMDDDTITSYEHEENGISVAISDASGVVTYSVDTTLQIVGDDGATTSVEVDLVGVDNNTTVVIDESEVEAESGLRTIDTTLDFDVDLLISGTSASSAVEMEVVEGKFSGTLVADITELRDDSGTSENGGDSDTETFDLADVVFDVEIALSEIDADNPVTFEGNLVLTLAALSLENEATDTNTYDQNGNWNGFETWSETITAGAMSVTLSGGFSNATGESVNASVAILADASDVVSECEGSSGFVDGVWVAEDVCTGETEQAYIDLIFTLAFSLNVTGVSNDISASISGTRTGLEDGTVDLELSYDGTMFDVEYDTENQTDTTDSFTITNQAGVVAALTSTEGDNGSVISGTITLNGATYATISEDNGFVAIAYVDGSNVSL